MKTIPSREVFLKWASKIRGLYSFDRCHSLILSSTSAGYSGAEQRPVCSKQSTPANEVSPDFFWAVRVRYDGQIVRKISQEVTAKILFDKAKLNVCESV